MTKSSNPPPPPAGRFGFAPIVPAQLLAAMLAVLPGCGRHAFPPPELAAEPVAGGLQVRVAGADDLLVTVFLNRPWSGEQALFPGLMGLRCSPVVLPDDRRLGAGVQGFGDLAGGAATFVIPAATVQAVPVPAVLQVLAARTLQDGRMALALSPALLLEREDGLVRVRSWPVGWGLARHAGGLLAALLGPVVLLLLLRRLRRPPPAWSCTAVLAGVIVLSLVVRAPLERTVAVEAGGAPPPLLLWPAPVDDVALLDRHYGPGVRELLDAVAAARRPGEPLTIVMGLAPVTGRELLAVHFAHRLPDVAVVRDFEAAAPGLVLRMLADPATLRRAAEEAATLVGAAPVPDEQGWSGEELARSPVGVLLRVERGR